MAENVPPAGDPPPDPLKDGETDEQKAARLETERATNKAEAQVKTWVKEALSEATPSLLETIKKALPATGAASATSQGKGRKSIFQTLTGG